MGILQMVLSAVSAALGYNLKRSTRFNSGDSAYLNWTPTSAGNRKTWTWSGWVKLCGSSGHLIAAGNDAFQFEIRSDGQYLIQNTGCFSNTYSGRVFKDYGAFYHFVIEHDATNAYCKIWVNGSLDQTITATNADGSFNNDTAHSINCRSTSIDSFTDFYISEVNFVDGLALDATSFGKTNILTGQWIPKEYEGTYGTNGFHLAMDPAVAGARYSDASNNVTADSNGVVNSFILDCVPVSNDFCYTSSNPIYGPNQIFGYPGGKIYTSHSGGGNSSEYKIDLAALVPGVTITSLRVKATDLGYDHWQMTVLDSSKNTISGAANGQAVTGANEEWQTVTVSGSPRYLKLDNIDDGSLRRCMLYGIEINGEVLIDHTAIGYDSSGQKNHWHENNLTADATVYSDTVSGGIHNGSYSLGFDGQLVAAMYPRNQDAEGNIVFAGGLSCDEVYCNTYSSSGTEFLTDSASSPTAVDTSSSFAWVSLPADATVLNEIKGTGGPGYNAFAIAAFKKDGNILIDGVPADLDLLADTPGAPYDNELNGGGNYCTLNPIDPTTATLSNGNLDCDLGNSATHVRGTFQISSGKWFWEITPTSLGGNMLIGICVPTQVFNGDLIASGGFTYSSYNGKYAGGSASAYGANYTTGDVIGVAFDADNGTLTYYKNGSSQGTAFTGLTDEYFPAVSDDSSQNASSFVANFGQRAFAYTPPTGYKSLNVFSLSEPTIVDPSLYFDTKIYAGTGATRNITMDNASLSPDLVWIKNRDSTYHHYLHDSVRGANKQLYSNTTGAETSDTVLTAFTSNGFTLSSDTGVNSGSLNYVAWAWDAGSSNTSVSAGDLNSSTYDQSQTWSGYLTSSTGGFYANQGAAEAFNGNFSDQAEPSSSGGTLTFTPTSAISFNSTVEIMSGGGDKDASFNGGTTVSTGTANTWKVIASGGGTLTTVSITKSGDWPTLKGLRIDGKILVDNGVTINAPSIDSTYRANPTAGFSIVKWAGDDNINSTVGHGLGSQLSMIICKEINGSDWWHVWVDGLDSVGHNMFLNNTNAQRVPHSDGHVKKLDNTTTFGFDSSTSNVDAVNQSGINNIAYCWSEVPGYSKFGSYTGTGTSDNSAPFVFCGFKPRWILTKRTDAADYWYIFDTARDVDNVVEAKLEPNSSAAEHTSADWLDILSNGFKIRATGGDINASGGTYIFAAFAETPFRYANAR